MVPTYEVRVRVRVRVMVPTYEGWMDVHHTIERGHARA
jgi:hypothetical protein